MKKYGYGVLAAIAVVLVSLSLSGSAQAYPDARVELTVSHKVVSAGDSFTATGTSNVACALDLEWNDVVRHSSPTKHFATRYVAPQVSKVTTIPLKGGCEAAAGTTGADRTLDVTVLPRANAAAPAPVDEGADLPGTGGPSWVVLLSGLVLALAGATAVTVARRRADEVELPGQTA
jgi:hypothetical protein